RLKSKNIFPNLVIIFRWILNPNFTNQLKHFKYYILDKYENVIDRTKKLKEFSKSGKCTFLEKKTNFLIGGILFLSFSRLNTEYSEKRLDREVPFPEDRERYFHF